MNAKKILVFAHVPPPHHGQSVMGQVLLDGLRADPRFEVHHVDARVSDDLEDVGSFRPRKFWRIFKCIWQAWWIRMRRGPMAFYYVPAPAKQSAILRDWVVMALCRPLFPELILHWHAFGLGEWVAAGNDRSRKLTRRALGKADLSIVLNNYNTRDAEVFAPKRIAVVPNGIADHFADYETALAPKRKDRAVALKTLRVVAGNESRVAGDGTTKLESVRFLFLGHLIESKGVFVAIEATRMANEELRKSHTQGVLRPNKKKPRFWQRLIRPTKPLEMKDRALRWWGFWIPGKKNPPLRGRIAWFFRRFTRTKRSLWFCLRR